LADLGGFTFVIVGNVDPASLQPLVERYLGSLPGTGRKQTWKDVGVTYATGRVTKELAQGSEPKSYVILTFGGPERWSRDVARDALVLDMVLNIRLREVLREDLGGVYGVQSMVSVVRQPAVRRQAMISFGCDPANVGKLRDAALGVIRDIQNNGISAPYLDKVREQLRCARETDAKENYWWAGQLYQAYWFGEDFAKTTDLAGTLARVTSARVQAAAKRFFDERHVVTGVLRPKTP
jgi:zinc protease